MLDNIMANWLKSKEDIVNFSDKQPILSHC